MHTASDIDAGQAAVVSLTSHSAFGAWKVLFAVVEWEGEQSLILRDVQ